MIDVARKDMSLMLEAGYIYLAMRRFNEAKQIFEGLSCLAPDHEVPLVAWANVFFAQQKYVEAVRKIKQALDVRPDSAFAWAHLGEAYFFQGYKDKALLALQKAQEASPDSAAARYAKTLKDWIDTGYDPRKESANVGGVR